MNNTEDTEIVPPPMAAMPVKNPPPPPGGGSWTWDDVASRWISNDQTDSTNAAEQE